MKKRIKAFIPKRFHSFILTYFIRPFIKNYRKSYAQCGEDMILDVILLKSKGFYIDIGANNPIYQSNTMYFYKKGWKGINIDATPGSMKDFRKLRKRDLNIEVAIANEEKEMIFYLFEPSFYNSFNEQYPELYKDKLIGQKSIRTTKLSSILDQYLGNPEIDFLTLDAEGYDYDILKSNNWMKYRPKVIVIEYITYIKRDLDYLAKIKEFLENENYRLFCNTPTNAFFLENKFFEERFKNAEN